MAIYGHNGFMPKGTACHIYLDKEQAAILDAIGDTMGKRRLGVLASRSQLISAAIRNFIEDCKAEEDLRETIAETLTQLRVEKESR